MAERGGRVHGTPWPLRRPRAFLSTQLNLCSGLNRFMPIHRLTPPPPPPEAHPEACPRQIPPPSPSLSLLLLRCGGPPAACPCLCGPAPSTQSPPPLPALRPAVAQPFVSVAQGEPRHLMFGISSQKDRRPGQADALLTKEVYVPIEDIAGPALWGSLGLRGTGPGGPASCPQPCLAPADFWGTPGGFAGT